MRFRAQKFFGTFLIVFFVGVVFYYVFETVVPPEAPSVSYEFIDGERKVSVFVPHQCDVPVRVYRSRNEGAAWERVRSFTYRQDLEGCTFLEPSSQAFGDVSSLLYRYQFIDMEREESKWSDVEELAL